MHPEDISVTPKKVNLFGLQISETIITAWIVMLIIIVFAIVVRVFLLKKFKTVPKGLQNILEMIIEFFDKFSKSILGKHGAAFCGICFYCGHNDIWNGACRAFRVQGACNGYQFYNSSFRMSFLIINAFGLYYTGLLGRLRWFFKPKAFMFPINIITHAIIPVSLAFRLFGNMFAGLVVMDLLYGVSYLAFGLPALVSIYFNLFHTGIQTYIFLVLTLSFMEETEVYGEKHIFKKHDKEKDQRKKLEA